MIAFPALSRPSRRTVGRWAFWLGALIVTTLVLLWARDDVEQSHVALTFLLVVLGGSAGGGRALGFFLAVFGFGLIDYFFQTPYGLLSVDKRLDWVVLVAFLGVAFVATELLARARAEAETARRLAREVEQTHALREANRAKDEVLTAISHDLRTPLTAIKLLAQRVAAGGDPTASAIEEQADRLAHLVTNVLDLSRIRAGAVKLDVELNTAEDLIGAAIQQAQPLLNGRRIVPSADFTGPVLAGEFDFVQSLRIVANLLENALRYTPSGGAVDVTTAREGEWLAIRIADRGAGVAPDERERVFEPFYRRAGQAADAGHVGLGLSIARRLAELQGGTLEHADRPGGGSVF
ncbi:MAG TPA: ATP-binding protein, partial [Gemmatimonadales bacterium]|nr:ATP-binding protein [Gemmatimonadales bacterium]